jgi:hypothetical protein
MSFAAYWTLKTLAFKMTLPSVIPDDQLKFANRLVIGTSKIPRQVPRYAIGTVGYFGTSFGVRAPPVLGSSDSSRHSENVSAVGL